MKELASMFASCFTAGRDEQQRASTAELDSEALCMRPSQARQSDAAHVCDDLDAADAMYVDAILNSEEDTPATSELVVVNGGGRGAHRNQTLYTGWTEVPATWTCCMPSSPAAANSVPVHRELVGADGGVGLQLAIQYSPATTTSVGAC